MKRPYQVTGVACILFAAFMARESIELEYYTALGPGPGFFPFWLSAIFGALAAIMTYHATYGRSRPAPADFIPSRAGYFRMAAIMIGLVATVILMNPLGFRFTMLAFLLFLFLALGRQNLIATAILSLAGSFGVYHVFVQWLLIPLPIGMLGI